ncbi:membrane-associated protein, putative [Bodo saltans]|uniref:Membrane-associated protein, putative n=1 Tax=Bodo saltans TaxID=75058 RepID=A0A0S4JPC5_BODSA|nr:membrane-associated protein, putative [Bodo saltans]|eukprot:CUG93372.1 membrane-associated protein, putative [Bodo saltans]
MVFPTCMRLQVLIPLCIFSVFVFVTMQMNGGLHEKSSHALLEAIPSSDTTFTFENHDHQDTRERVTARHHHGKKWWPFRYVHPQLEAHMVMGSAVRAPDALCELMVLGHPLCDYFLTDPEQHPVRHPEGAMVECIEANGGLEAWDAVVQTQCTQSTFWRGLVAKAKADGAVWGRNRSAIDALKATLMDPVMRVHVGPMPTRYVPVSERTYSPVAPPLVCAPPDFETSDCVAEWLEKKKLRPPFDGPRAASRAAPGGRVKVFDWFPVTPGYYPFFKPQYFRKFKKRPRYAAMAKDEYVTSIIQRLSYFAWTHGRGGPDCMRHYEILAAGGVPYFPDIGVYPPWVLSHLPKALLKRVHRLRGVSHIGSVEDILRPADVAFYNESEVPRWRVRLWRAQRKELMRRLEVSFSGKRRALATQNGDNRALAQLPDALAALWDDCFAPLDDRALSGAVIEFVWRWSVFRGVVIDERLWRDVLTRSPEGLYPGHRNESHDAERLERCIAAAVATESPEIPSGVSSVLSGTTAEWAEWFVLQLVEEFHDEGLVPLFEMIAPTAVFTKIANGFFFRTSKDRAFNFFDRGTIKWDASPSFDDEYHALAAELHAHTKEFLTTASVASHFLRTLGREDARSVLFFGNANCDYMTFSLWHGLLELGLNVSAVPHVNRGSVQTRYGPMPLAARDNRSSVLVRDFGPEGAIVPGTSASLFGGEEYNSWRESLNVSLDDVYGKNFMVGKRIPKHPLITEEDACESIRAQTRRIQSLTSANSSNSIDDVTDDVDVVVLTSRHTLATFQSYPCSRDVRELLAAVRNMPSLSSSDPRNNVVVAFVDGFDSLSTQSALTFFREGIHVFAREPKCW